MANVTDKAKARSERDSLLKPGDIVRERYEVGGILGSGGFGTVYEIQDRGGQGNAEKPPKLAIKVEPTSPRAQVLRMEIAVLKRLSGSPHFCQLYNFARNERFTYVIMSLLGKNLGELRKSQPGTCFSLGTTFRICSQMLIAIQALHRAGFVHRDIKPTNFAMGLNENSHRCYLIDFGLSRRYLDDNNKLKEPRLERAGFRGTARYASMNAHLRKELGPCDDLWSLLYVMYEFVQGGLPWRRIGDKEEVGDYKVKYDHFSLLIGMPEEYGEFLRHLYTLVYSSTANYDKLQRLFQSVLERLGVTENDPHDWEKVKRKNEEESELSTKRACMYHESLQDAVSAHTAAEPHPDTAERMSSHDVVAISRSGSKAPNLQKKNGERNAAMPSPSSSLSLSRHAKEDRLPCVEGSEHVLLQTAEHEADEEYAAGDEKEVSSAVECAHPECVPTSRPQATSMQDCGARDDLGLGKFAARQKETSDEEDASQTPALLTSVDRPSLQRGKMAARFPNPRPPDCDQSALTRKMSLLRRKRCTIATAQSLQELALSAQDEHG